MKVAELGQKSKLIMGQAPPGKECNLDGIGTPFVKAGQFGTFKPVVEEWTTKPLKLAQSGDVLICVVGATSGKINFGADCAIGRSVAAVRPNPSELDQKYLYYFLSTWTDRLRSGSQGSAQGVITRRMLESLQIPFPPIEEQRRIAAILDKADGVRRKRKEAIALTEELLRSAFLDMFGDPVTNPKGWEKVTVDDLVSAVRDGPHVSPKYSDEGIPILSTRNIRPGRLILEDVKFVSDEVYETLISKFKPQKGDVLLTKGRAIASYFV